MTDDKLFKSFLMGGFEGACHINSQGRRLDMIEKTQHDVQVETDYALVRSEGIETIRDGVRWHLIETAPGVYDFSSLKPLAEAAHRQGVQVIWTLCHYGWPSDLDVFSPAFVTRFAAFGKAVAAFLKPYTHGTPLFTPVNEISYFCWVGGETGGVHPYAHGRGYEMKVQLVKATLACMDAIWDISPDARFVHVEPLIHVAIPRDYPERLEDAKAYHLSQFEAYDMIAGILRPDLGGAMKYLDIIGSNFYHDNQWVYYEDYIPWNDADPHRDWMPLHDLVKQVYARYQRPMILSETSHYGSNRPTWMRMITREVAKTVAAGLPLLGVCLYPIIDRSDWENDDHWHNSGLWDYQPGDNGRQLRVLATDYATEFRRAAALFNKPNSFVQNAPENTGAARGLADRIKIALRQLYNHVCRMMKPAV